MYISLLLIDTGDNPDRPRPGRIWLRNLYHVHQRLCMAFPSDSRKSADAHFLKPFNPEEFGKGHVHVNRAENSGFLFRIDPLPNGRAAILVQSVIEPDWEYAFHNACYLLAAKPHCRPFDPRFTSGQRLRFRLAANPTRRLSEKSPDAKRESFRKRVPVPTDKLPDWLARRADSAGFHILKLNSIQTGYVYFKKPGPEARKSPTNQISCDDDHGSDKHDNSDKDQKSRLRLARYEGVLEVTDPDKFRKTIVSGLGSAKAFGFGLLSVAPYDGES